MCSNKLNHKNFDSFKIYGNKKLAFTSLLDTNICALFKFIASLTSYIDIQTRFFTRILDLKYNNNTLLCIPLTPPFKLPVISSYKINL
jgi:hypothetical protein